MAVNPRLRATLRWMALSLAALALVLLALYGLLQTPPVRSFVADGLARRIGAPLNSQVRLEGFRGPMPQVARVDRVVFEDPHGVWLTLEGVHIDWSPLALVRGRFRVREVSAQRAHVVRPPDRQRPLRIPRLPKRVPNLTVELLRIGALTMGAQDASHQLTVQGDVQYMNATNGLRAELQVHELDGPPVTGTARLAIQTSPSSSLDVDVRYDEPQSGPLGAWLGEPAGPSSLRLTGTGPLEAWNADLHARAGEQDIVRGRLRLTEAQPADGLALALDGSLNMPQKTLPPRLQGVLGVENRFSIQVQLAQERQVTVSEAAVTSLLGNLKTSGTIDFKTGAINISFSTHIQELAAVRELIGLGIEGQGSAEGTVTGQLKQPQVGMTISASNLTFGGARAESLTGQLRLETLEPWEGLLPLSRFSGEGMITRFLYKQAPFLPEGTFDWRLAGETQPDGQITMRELVLANPAVSLTFTGGYNIQSKEATFDMQFSSEDIEPIASAVGLSAEGAATLNLRAQGKINNLQITADASGRGLTVQGVPVELRTAHAELSNVPAAPRGDVRVVANWQGREVAAEAEVAVEPPVLKVSDIRLSAPATEVTGSLTASLETGLIDATLTGRSDDLVQLGQVVNEPLEGSLNFDVALKSSEGRQDLTLELAAESLVTPWLTAEMLTASADLTDVRKTPAGVASIHGTNLAIGTLASSDLEARYEGGADAGSVSANMHGTLQEPLDLALLADWEREQSEAVVRLTKLDGAWGAYPLRLEQPAVLRLAPDRLALAEATVQAGPGSITAEAAYSTDNLDATIDFDQLPLEMLGAAGGPAFSGTGGGSLQVHGPPGEPRAHVELQLASLGALPPREGAPPVDVALGAQYESGRVEGSLSLTRLFEAPVEATFSAPLVLSISPAQLRIPREEPLEVVARFAGTLERINALVPLNDQQIGGRFRGDVTLSGSLAEPIFAGEAEITNGSYDHFRFGTLARDLNARLVAEGPVVRVVSARATDGGNGTVDITGELVLELDEGVPLDAIVTLNNFRAVRREDFAATTTGTLNLGGTLSSMRVTGALNLDPATVYLQGLRASPVAALEVQDVNVPPELREAVAAVAPPPPEQPREIPPFFQRIALNIDLNMQGRATATGYGVESEWRGGFQVSGTAAAPTVTGELRAIRGQMGFAGRTFRLQEGTITLRGQSPPDPLLNIEGESKAQEVTALVRIAGPASNPQLSLESTPPMPRDEVLARILFGRDATRVSPVQAVQLARTANALATGREGFGLLGQVGKALGLEGLTLQETGEAGGEFGLGFGRYLGENVYLNVAQGFGGAAGQVSIEIELNKYLTLESTISQQAQTGVSLNWKRDY